MIRPKEMTMVRIITPSRHVRNVIETLYELKVLHILDFKKGEDEFFDIGKPFKEATTYSEQLIALRSIISRLSITGTPKDLKNLSDAQKRLLELNKSFKDTVEKLDKTKSVENELLNDYKNPLANLGISHKIKEFKSLVSFLGTVKSPIESKLNAITTDYSLTQKKLEKRIAFALFIKRELGEKVKAILSESGFAEHQLPKLNRTEIEERLAKIRKEKIALENQLETLKKNNSQFLVDYEFALTQLNEQSEVPLRFASSKNTLIATGWIPADKAENIKQNLAKITKEKVFVELLHGKNPPTVLENPKMINPFEFLLNLYSLPKYYEIDPTILMFIAFPLFFGFMLGDVGYGLTTLAIIFLLEKKLPTAIKPLLRIITISSLSSIAFGFIFGEFFGYEFIAHPLLNRVHEINTMMLISVAVGVVHINLGLVLGLINELKHHNFLEAFLRKGSWIVLQVAVAILGFGYLQANQSFQMIGGILILASILMIIKGEGILKIVELPAILSNTLSYIRLYAIGLASVSLASVFNKMASGFFVQGGFSIAIGIFVLLAGHFINLLLGLLGPFLHSLRLHYVEFFQKFYEGGGYRYSPFGIIKMLGGR
ncbi:MAG: V-type ATP synthase subunit I [Candidatus Aenigmarchaeota archaeon]|nr:V-type ATP synthase subunit I [Candidatus Aenigmarchaeota archaeon]